MCVCIFFQKRFLYGYNYFDCYYNKVKRIVLVNDLGFHRFSVDFMWEWWSQGLGTDIFLVFITEAEAEGESVQFFYMCF